MKKFRVFQTVNGKRIVSGFSFRSPGTILLFLILLPYMISLCFGNIQKETEEVTKQVNERLTESRVYIYNETSVGTEKIPLEIYVADKLSRSMDDSYEPEALKAQAVLIRSEAYAVREDRGEEMEIFLMDEGYGSRTISEKQRQAVAETGGICLTYQGEPVSGAYFAVSNGATRDAQELGLTEYPYLKGVLCDRDFLSPDYSSTEVFQEREFERIWEECSKAPVTEKELMENEKVRKEAEDGETVIYRDSAGYVLYAERNHEFVSGEQMRIDYNLPSADFHIEKENHKISFTVHGKGHGIGMSQFAANEMAKKGEDYTEILNYFFQEATISKFE